MVRRTELTPLIKDHIVLDGVTYRVPTYLEVGMSFFMPCLNHKKAIEVASRHYSPWFTLKGYPWIEQGALGVRLWRV